MADTKHVSFRLTPEDVETLRLARLLIIAKTQETGNTKIPTQTQAVRLALRFLVHWLASEGKHKDFLGGYEKADFSKIPGWTELIEEAE